MPRVDPQVALQDARQTQQLRVVAQTMGHVGQNSENHWSIFLLTSNNQSVRSNMATPKYGDPTGELQWEQQPYALTNSAISHWDFPIAANTRICDVASLLYGLNRHSYEMSGGGSGCRWWCYVVLCDLSNFGYIHSSVPGSMYLEMLYRYHKTQPRKPLHMPQGEFFPRLIAQPEIYRTGTVAKPNGPPRQDLILVTVNNRQQWTMKSGWTYYEDINGNPCLCNSKYNLCYYFPATDYHYTTLS